MNVLSRTTLTLATVALFTQTSPVLAQAAPGAFGCDYTDSALYGGWGWNNTTQQSCEPLTNNTTTNVQAPAPIISSPASGAFCDDPDGDGWGWDGSASCRVGAAQSTTPQVATPASGAFCDDPDGDGWGWDGSASCRVGGSAANTPVVITPVVSAPTETGACIDSDGDGWGWNGTSSCTVNSTPTQTPATPTQTPTAGPQTPTPDTSTGGCQAPPSGSSIVSQTSPVHSTGNSFFPDRGAQCVVPTNQFNGPGLRFGDFLLSNNAWNGDKSTFDWLQCISLTETNGRVNPSWTYDWGNEDDLLPGFREWEVKSYPEIIYGFKSNEERSATCEETGLPVTFSEVPQIDIAYEYRSTQTNNRVGDFGPEYNNPIPVTGGDRNIALESFLHSSCDIRRGSDSNREFELMVWLEHGPERLPSGSPPVSVYTDSFGRTYDVYVKGASDPGYIAYVAQNKQTRGTLNWNEFFADAQRNADTYGVRRLNNNWCLANILFGTEIWWGEGSFSIDQYDITRTY